MGKLHITRENIVSLVAMLPYLEGRVTIQVFYVQLNNDAYFRPILGWFLLLLPLLALWFILYKNKHKEPCRYYNILLPILCILTLYTVSFSSNKITALSTWSWFGIPIIEALLLMKYCRNARLDISKILRGMLYLFCAFAFITLIYSAFVLRTFDASEGRMNARAGGPVIFGYTAAVYFAICLCQEKKMPKMAFYSILAFLTVVSLATGSRGAVWPIVMMWVIRFFIGNLTIKKIIVGVPIIILGVILFARFDGAPVSIQSDSRLFRTESLEREFSTVSALEVLSENSTDNLIGQGIGNFFPYQRWVIDGCDMDRHTFSYDNLVFLVQPHNSFIYMAIECGLISLILFLSVFIRAIWTFIKNKNTNYGFATLFVVTLIFVNCFDSIFFVEPGVALVYWVLFIAIYEQQHTLITVKERGA